MQYDIKILNPDLPVLGMALHHGHTLRKEAQELMQLSDAEYLREEDPFTGEFAQFVDNTVIVETSRFEVDLNRPRDKAVYILPEDAWGLNVWKSPPTDEFVQGSLKGYDAFYQEMERVLGEFCAKHKRVVIYDIHSYNHRRNGPDAEPADSELNPEVNLGTRTMNREQWSAVIDRFLFDLRHFNYFEHHLDARENVKFFGGNFAAWAHKRFSNQVCVLSIEFKKFFMNEWTGAPNHNHIKNIKWALETTLQGVLKEIAAFE